MNTERAIEALTWIKDKLIISAEYKKALDMAIEALSEERTGEWEKFSFPDGDVMECTNCGYRDWADVWEEGSRNFCPNCGAKMGGDTE